MTATQPQIRCLINTIRECYRIILNIPDVRISEILIESARRTELQNRVKRIFQQAGVSLTLDDTFLDLASNAQHVKDQNNENLFCVWNLMVDHSGAEALKLAKNFPTKLKDEIEGFMQKNRYKVDQDFAQSLNQIPVKVFEGLVTTLLTDNNGPDIKLIDAVSNLPYEGTKANGSILCGNDSDYEMVIQFETPISMQKHRAVRKLLELSRAHGTESYSLIYCNGNIIGLGTKKEQQEWIQVRITGPSRWELAHQSGPLVISSHGVFNLPKKDDPLVKFKQVYESVFGASSDAKMDEIVTSAILQTHGTMLVISEDASSEAKRLQSRSTAIAPTDLKTLGNVREVILAITAIDGAILVDKDCTCHAIGVILDGKVAKNNEGSKERGARFNSAVTYISDRTKTVIVIVSEDGMVDTLP